MQERGPKVETVEEFLSRGGTITKCPTPEYSKREQVNPTPNSVATILSLAEADLMYGEAKKRKTPSAPAKSKFKIDMKMLPEELRAKFLTKVMEASDEEDSKG